MAAEEVERYLFTLDEFERMVGADVFAPELRIELIEGEIVKMAPINFPHESCLARIQFLLNEGYGRSAYVWPQNNSLRLLSESRPQPDLTMLKWRDDLYIDTRPAEHDVLLVVEVSDTSLQYDRGQKRALYARAGISDYWIVDIKGKAIEWYSNPEEGSYKEVQRAAQSDSLPLPGKPGAQLQVAEVFPHSL